MKEHLYPVNAVILKRTDVGEADRLLTLFTAERGKLRAVAKGARKPSSRKTGHVELFNHVSLLIAVGRELDIITQADTLEPFQSLRRDLDRLSYAYYFAELVDRFTEEGEENRVVYELILNGLRWLEQTGHLERSARYFELQLLDALGYRPELYYCINCRAQVEPEENFFTPEGGGVLHPKCRDAYRDPRALSLNALKVLRFLQGRTYSDVDSLRLTMGVENEVEELLHYNLSHLLEKSLKSVEFLNTLRANTLRRVNGESHNYA